MTNPRPRAVAAWDWENAAIAVPARNTTAYSAALNLRRAAVTGPNGALRSGMSAVR